MGKIWPGEEEMAKTSDFTQAVQNIIAEGTALRRQAEKAKPVPFMQERLNKRDALNRVGRMTPQDLGQMTPEQRQALVKSVGTDAVLGVIRRNPSV